MFGVLTRQPSNAGRRRACLLTHLWLMELGVWEEFKATQWAPGEKPLEALAFKLILQPQIPDLTMISKLLIQTKFYEFSVFFLVKFRFPDNSMFSRFAKQLGGTLSWILDHLNPWKLHFNHSKRCISS